MAGEVRVFLPGQTYELTVPVLNLEKRLRPQDDVHVLLLRLLGALSRARGIRLHAYAATETRVHLLVTPEEPQAIPVAMQDFKSAAARCINKLQGRRGPVWDGPYLDTPVTDEVQAQLSRLRAVLRIGDPGRSSQDILAAPYLNAAKQWTGIQPVPRSDLWLEPLPVLVQASEETRQAVVWELLAAGVSDEEAVARATEVLALATAGEGPSPATTRLLEIVNPLTGSEGPEPRDCAQPPGEPANRPAAGSPRRANKPTVHAATATAREACLSVLYQIREAYRTLAARFMNGELWVAFPSGTLRPPAWRATWPAGRGTVSQDIHQELAA